MSKFKNHEPIINCLKNNYMYVEQLGENKIQVGFANLPHYIIKYGANNEIEQIKAKYTQLEERNLSTPEDLPDYKYVKGGMWALEWVLSIL